MAATKDVKQDSAVNGRRIATSSLNGPAEGSGPTIFSGFVDPHVHIWKVGQLLTDHLDLREMRSLRELLESVKAFGDRLPREQWLRARGYNEALFTDEKRPPTLAELDAVLGERPAFIQRTCAHIALAGSATLKAARIDKHTPDPPGGYIQRDANGAATGLFCESAMGLIQDHIPAASQQDYGRWILAGCRALLKHGIVAATDPAVMPDLLAAYRALDERGELPMPISVLAIRRPDGGSQTLPLPDAQRGNRLTVEGVKFFADGGLSGRTAAINGGYRDDPLPGVLRFDGEDEEAEFLALAREAAQQNLGIGTHAIGDRAIAQVLRIYAAIRAEFPQANLRIEHFGLPSPEQLAQTARLNIKIFTQPIFLYELGDNFRDYLTNDYLQRCYPFRSMMQAGLSVRFSSDGPVVKDLNPLRGIEAAVQRRSVTGELIQEGETLTIDEALSAYIAPQNSTPDPLDLPKNGTRVQLSGNLLKTPLNRWDEIEPTRVFIGGESVI